jgi:hypothetical protein
MRLDGMRASYDEVMSIGRKQGHTAEKILLSLLEAENTERETRGLRYRLGQARFPIQKEASDFDFPASDVDAEDRGTPRGRVFEVKNQRDICWRLWYG